MSSTRMPQLPVRSAISRSATSTFHSRGAGLAPLVDGQRDDRGAVLADHGHDPGDARVGPVAVLVVDRVDDRAAAGQLQPGLDHRGPRSSRAPAAAWRRWPACPPPRACRPPRPGRRSRRRRRAGARRPGSGTGRSARSPRTVPSQHRLAERLGPVGVGPLADGQEGGVLAEGHVRVQRGDAGLAARPARRRGPAAHPVGQRGDVLGGGAAAAAHQRQAELPGEPLVRVGQLRRGQRVAGAVGR